MELMTQRLLAVREFSTAAECYAAARGLRAKWLALAPPEAPAQPQPPPPTLCHPMEWRAPRLSVIDQSTIMRIKVAICAAACVGMKDLLSGSRKLHIVVPRQIGMALSRYLTPHSLPHIGRCFGARHHTTVLHGFRKYKRLIEHLARTLPESATIEDWANAALEKGAPYARAPRPARICELPLALRPSARHEAVAVHPAARGARMIEKHQMTNHAQLHGLRKFDVTASTAPALVGVSPFMSPLALYLLKAGILAEDPEETPPMRRGRLLESVAAQILCEDRPDWKIQYPVGLYFRDPEARIGCTPDCLVTDENGKTGVVQIKSVERTMFSKWRENDGTFSPPLHVVLQALVEGFLTDADWAAVAPLVIGFGVELPLINIPLHAGAFARIKEEVAKFWDRVARKDPPPPDYARDGKLIAKLFPESDGHIIDLSSDNMLPELVVQDRALADEIKERKDRREAIKSEILMKLGTASGATFQGGRITANTVHRKGYYVAATSYRDLRIRLEEQGELRHGSEMHRG
jgi:predicted phage-related endonuclease